MSTFKRIHIPSVKTLLEALCIAECITYCDECNSWITDGWHTDECKYAVAYKELVDQLKSIKEEEDKKS